MRIMKKLEWCDMSGVRAPQMAGCRHVEEIDSVAMLDVSHGHGFSRPFISVAWRIGNNHSFHYH